MDVNTEEETFVVVLPEILDEIRISLLLFVELYESIRRRRITYNENRPKSYSLISRLPYQISHMRNLVGFDNETCRNNLRMNVDTFNRLCYLLENNGGLTPTRNVLVQEQVAMFLHILAHHKKNVILQTNYQRSGYTISKYFGRVMKAVLKLHTIFLVEPEPVLEECDDERWKFFKGCLGALDGTYVLARVPRLDKPRYRNRKGDISVNILGVCDRNINFVYMLAGWEGSAADSRVLRDAITRPNGLRVPTGQYYLVDNGYTNGDGFLAPYRKTRYHLKEFGANCMLPQNYKEYFNLKHAKARNVIERAFGILKSRWGILRSAAYYPIKMQNRIIMACSLLHNFIRTHNDYDPEEEKVPEDEEFDASDTSDDDSVDVNDDEFIGTVEASNEWTAKREEMAQAMYNEWLASH